MRGIISSAKSETPRSARVCTCWGAAERIAHRDHDLAGPHSRKIGLPRLGVGPQTAHLQHDFRRERFIPRNKRSALVGVLLVGIPGGYAGARLHQHVRSRIWHERNVGGNERDAPFTGKCVLDYRNLMVDRFVLRPWGDRNAGSPRG